MESTDGNVRGTDGYRPEVAPMTVTVLVAGNVSSTGRATKLTVLPSAA